jgi:deoxyribose-phosphate aldolase
MNSMLASVIDHTLLKADATERDVRRLCREARRYRFAAVCVNPAYVPLAAELVSDAGVRVAAVIGFPLGASTIATKVSEARDAVRNGANELDIVMNIGALKSGKARYVLNELRSVRKATRGKILKVIIETAYLSKSEKIEACCLAKKAGADFVKTSTGFALSGATESDIRLMRKAVGAGMGIKAAGGIRTREQALRMLAAGATRIGASASIMIVTLERSGKH